MVGAASARFTQDQAGQTPNIEGEGFMKVHSYLRSYGRRGGCLPGCTSGRPPVLQQIVLHPCTYRWPWVVSAGLKEESTWSWEGKGSRWEGAGGRGVVDLIN